MPYKLAKERKGSGFQVTSPNGTKGRHMTLENANKQIRLLQAIEHDPNFKVRKK